MIRHLLTTAAALGLTAGTAVAQVNPLQFNNPASQSNMYAGNSVLRYNNPLAQGNMYAGNPILRFNNGFGQNNMYGNPAAPLTGGRFIPGQAGQVFANGNGFIPGGNGFVRGGNGFIQNGNGFIPGGFGGVPFGANEFNGFGGVPRAFVGQMQFQPFPQTGNNFGQVNGFGQPNVNPRRSPRRR